ncbi:very short patch repair endonuclease [Methylorubrum zatmanii]
MKRGDAEWVVPSPGKSAAMRGVRTIGTAPEIELRRRLHRAGLRFRVGLPVPGKPRRTIDIAFTRARLAVFVDGCFWHGCPIHSGKPRTNAAFWEAKLAGNQARDRDTDACLKAAGWTVLRLWEHVGPDEAADAVRKALTDRTYACCSTPFPPVTSE